ncbi:porin [Pelagibacteraceae bacterium]|nr:porin [Pelagibacteraceae bacterium]
MKNIIKIALVMLSVISFSAVQAGELTVTGSAKASYVILSSDSTTALVEDGKGFGVSNEFTLGANGELDNGWTWKYFMDIDNATVQDDGGLSITTPMATVALNVSDGGLELSKGAVVSATGDRGSDSAYGEGMAEEYSIGDMTNIQIHTPAGLLPLNTVVKIGYAPNTTGGSNRSVNTAGGTSLGGFTAAVDSGAVFSATGQNANMGSDMTQYQVKAEPIDGLTAGASYTTYDMDNSSAGQSPEAGSWYAKYAVGPVTAAYGRTYIAVATASIAATYETVKNSKMGASYAVNDDLNFSYAVEKSEATHMLNTTADVEMEVQQIAAAYTMGGMTLAVSQNSYDNSNYTANKDAKSTVFNLSMAF